VGLQYLFSQQKPITSKLAFNWALGLGAVYFNKPYHYIDNPKNIANGSHLAFLVELNLGLRYQFTANYSLSGAFVMLHSSNGHTVLPNVGTNIPAYRLALCYQPSNNKSISRVLPTWERTKEHNLRLSLGQNEFGRSTAPTNGPPQHIYLLSYQHSMRYSIKGRWYLGAEGYYNGGYRLYLKSQEIAELEDKFTNASALVVFVGHEYRYGHYGLLVQAGYNIHNPFLHYFIKENQPGEKLKAHLPGKFGVNYYIKNPFIHHRTNFYIGAYIKSNVTQADFLETGAGILF
jgi:hypothetical protein